MTRVNLLGMLGSVKAGPSYKKLDGPPKYNLKALDLTPKIPIKFADEKDNKPIYVIPEIIIPSKRRKIVIHHSRPRMSYIEEMTQRLNPVYLSFLMNNPAYAPFTKKNPYLDYYVNKDTKRQIKKISGAWFKKWQVPSYFSNKLI